MNWSAGTEILLHCYADDLQATASINGAVTTSLGGNIELLTEENDISKSISIDGTFEALGDV